MFEKINTPKVGGYTVNGDRQGLVTVRGIDSGKGSDNLYNFIEYLR